MAVKSVGAAGAWQPPVTGTSDLIRRRTDNAVVHARARARSSCRVPTPPVAKVGQQVRHLGVGIVTSCELSQVKNGGPRRVAGLEPVEAGVRVEAVGHPGAADPVQPHAPAAHLVGEVAWRPRHRALRDDAHAREQRHSRDITATAIRRRIMRLIPFCKGQPAQGRPSIFSESGIPGPAAVFTSGRRNLPSSPEKIARRGD